MGLRKNWFCQDWSRDRKYKVHPNYRSRLHREILTSGNWCHTTCHTNYVVNAQVGLPDYGHQNIILYAVLEEGIYTKISEGMEEVLEGQYM